MMTGFGPAARSSASRLDPTGTIEVGGSERDLGLTALNSARRGSLSGGLSTAGLSISGASVAVESKMFVPDILNGGSEGSESIQKDQRCATIQDWKDC